MGQYENVKDTEIALAAAGIAEPETFNGWLTQMAETARRALDETPAIERCDTQEDYRYIKMALSNLRKVKKESEEGRKRITGELDRAKKAVMSFTADSIEPVEDAIRGMAALKAGTEERWRDEKSARLERYWEETYPALALCTGEASEPLVPYARIADPDWVKRVSELDRDRKPREAMDALADRLSDGQRAIEALEVPDAAKSAALSCLFRELDASRALIAANEEARRLRDLDRLRERSETVAGATAEDAAASAEPPVIAPETEAPAPAPETAGKPAKAVWVVEIECETDAECARVKALMVANGIHGKIRRVYL